MTSSFRFHIAVVFAAVFKDANFSREGVNHE
jgi:hypothetical protein